MTLNEIIDVIVEPFGRPLDYAFREQTKIRVKNWRTKLLRDSLNRNSNDRRHYLQSFGTTLVLVPEVECPITTGCDILRSEKKIPKPVRIQGLLFDYVGTIDFKKPYSHSLPEQAVFYKHMKYFSSRTTYSYINDYIWIQNPPSNDLKYLGVRLIPEDPEDLTGFICDSNISKCYDDNS